MEMTGSQRIEASRERVWQALNDPEILKASIPGCERIEKLSDTEMAATVTLKVGPVKASFQGDVKLADLDPPNGYTITGEGRGGAAGFAKGAARVSLIPEGSATVLSYSVKADVGGKLAQLGGRLIDSTARRLAAEFFDRFAQAMDAACAGGAPGTPQLAGSAAEAIPIRARSMRSSPVLWASGAVIAIVLAAILFWLQ
ncbi:MAG: SRPBCC family protein [Pseudomonadota bacterium]